jgi:hypothetical protein
MKLIREPTDLGIESAAVRQATAYRSGNETVVPTSCVVVTAKKVAKNFEASVQVS